MAQIVVVAGEWLHCYLYLYRKEGPHHPLRMYGGQTPVLYGCTYLLSWGWRFMVKQLNTKKN
jgi:hypothetical protein